MAHRKCSCSGKESEYTYFKEGKIRICHKFMLLAAFGNTSLSFLPWFRCCCLQQWSGMAWGARWMVEMILEHL